MSRLTSAATIRFVAANVSSLKLLVPGLLGRATLLGRMVFSPDEDLVVEAVRRQRGGQPFATVVFARQLDLSIGRCIADLEALAKAATDGDAQGQVIFL